ncbi:hypothetical protein Bpfe_006604, partial [Biomphalaria pfeifferi]
PSNDKPSSSATVSETDEPAFLIELDSYYEREQPLPLGILHIIGTHCSCCSDK